jgi:hypothetical protein
MLSLRYVLFALLQTTSVGRANVGTEPCWRLHVYVKTF